MNISKKLARGILLTWLAILLTACSPQDKGNTTVDVQSIRTAQCIAQQSQCQFDLAGGQVQVLFTVDRIVAEQEFNMVLNYQGPQALTSVSGYLEGVNMYMGKIPLFIEEDFPNNKMNNKKLDNVKPEKMDITQLKIDNEFDSTFDSTFESETASKQVFKTEVLVGSCSAEEMTWRIWLTFTTVEQKTYTKMLTVASYRS
ncbi:hypothetical protein H4J59_02040 [Colwellia sp. MB02u-10]|uniref:hypothetical protein n=1 Tax=Colwellia sp. MB02u-10 TaxID=2759828 RepID=UPI0015F70421|nr:hypothetical protein [Colwellia sp. MB02u-10]MBA6339793.1 hypothetical protein [Colwellia sp. MB02u-10]